MSRVTKEEIDIKNIKKYTIEKNLFIVEGSLGINKVNIPEFLVVSEDKENKSLSIDMLDTAKAENNKHYNAMHGTIVRLVKNAVTGVTVGFKKVFLLKGLGYKCVLSDNLLTLSLGYSSPVSYLLPENVKATVPKPDKIELKSIDKELLGRCKDKITKLRKWTPYSGKGIIEEGERPYIKPVIKTKK